MFASPSRWRRASMCWKMAACAQRARPTNCGGNRRSNASISAARPRRRRWRRSALSEFGQYLVTGIATGASFALVALGFVAIYRVTHVVNFAQGAFAMLGGFVMSSMLDRALPEPLAALCAIVIVAGIGPLVGVIAV